MRYHCWLRWPLGVLIALVFVGQLKQLERRSPELRGRFSARALGVSIQPGASVFQIVVNRVRVEPFNLLATGLFLLAIAHTFVASSFTRLAHKFEQQHRARLDAKRIPNEAPPDKDEVSFKAQVFHFLGEVEAIFGIWVVPLLLSIAFVKGWPTARAYFNHYLDFTEPVFVVVIMTIAASRPIVRFAEGVMAAFARLGGRSMAAWWFSILTIGPLLGSFITEPAAMTISALLLAGKFYDRKPSPNLAYATLGLLFVNVSVGGTLTHFAAPPVLMVAGRWGWDMTHMLTHFGWKATAGIVAANLLYFLAFRSEFRRLNAEPRETAEVDGSPLPVWVTAVHMAFLIWTVMNSHAPVLFIGGFLFYLAFTQATEHHQDDLRLRPALLVGFFLAGLVVHGGLQGWWIGPVLEGAHGNAFVFRRRHSYSFQR